MLPYGDGAALIGDIRTSMPQSKRHCNAPSMSSDSSITGSDLTGALGQRDASGGDGIHLSTHHDARTPKFQGVGSPPPLGDQYQQTTA